MCLGAMCIGIGSHKGVFVTKKTSCINEGIFTTCHKICGVAMPHIVMANLAYACCFASSVCDGIDTAWVGIFVAIWKFECYNTFKEVNTLETNSQIYARLRQGMCAGPAV